MVQRVKAAWGRGRELSGRLSAGIIDQGISSATNFGLTVVAGRLLGPGGLGVVFVGFAVYLLALSFQRALITDPLIVVSARMDDEARRQRSRAALAIVLLSGGVLTVVFFAAGALFTGSIGHGMWLFAPWLMLALVQDFWRALLFNDSRGSAAACNDGVWLLVMVLALPLAWWSHSEVAIVATWGLGASAGGLFGFWQTKLLPSGLPGAFRWWREEVMGFARWLAIENAVISLQNQGMILVLAAILGSRDIGGLRAVDSVFAPMTLLGEAFGLPGLPLLARSLGVSFAAARRLAMRLSMATVAIVVVYLAVAGAFREQILSLTFGESFESFGVLVVPVGLAQLFLAWNSGFWLLAKAAARGRVLVIARVCLSLAMFSLAVLGGLLFGLSGAAWGIAAGVGIGTIMITVLATRDQQMPEEAALGPHLTPTG
jgi:O-antigen/teichoic acid export membrane protein